MNRKNSSQCNAVGYIQKERVYLIAQNFSNHKNILIIIGVMVVQR